MAGGTRRPAKRRRKTPPWDLLPEEVLNSIFFSLLGGSDEPCYLPVLETDNAPLRARQANHVNHRINHAMRDMMSMMLTCRSFCNAVRNFPRHVLLRWVVRRRCEELKWQVDRPLPRCQGALIPNPDDVHKILQRAVMSSYFRGSRTIVDIRRKYNDSKTLVHRDDYVRARIINLEKIRHTVDPRRENLNIPSYHFCYQNQLLAILAVEFTSRTSPALPNWAEVYHATARRSPMAPRVPPVNKDTAHALYIGLQCLLVRTVPTMVARVVAVDKDTLLQKTLPNIYYHQGLDLHIHDGRYPIHMAVISDAINSSKTAFKYLPMINRCTKAIFFPVVRRDPETLNWVGARALKTDDISTRRFIRSYILSNFDNERCMQCVPMKFRKDMALVRQCLRCIPAEQVVRRCQLLNAMPKAVRSCPTMAAEVFGKAASGEPRGYMASPGVMVLYKEKNQVIYGTLDGTSSHILQ